MERIARQRLAQTLRQLRLAKGLRQSDLAVLGQISRSAISALERAQIENPSKALITAVATALSVRYEDLVGFSEAEVTVMGLLDAARPLWQNDSKKALQHTQRALVRARQLHLHDVDREIAALLAEEYAALGDPIRAAAFAVGGLIGPPLDDPRHQGAVIALAKPLRDLGEWPAATALYRNVLFGLHRANPRFARVFLHLGCTYADAHQYSHAVRAFVRAHRDAVALSQTDLSGWALVGMAQSLGFVGRQADAIAANDQAKILASTYNWPDLESAVLRTGEVLDLLFSRSLVDARNQWLRVTKLLEKESVSDNVTLLNTWINYASRHEAWSEVLFATEVGLALLRSTASVPSRGAKGQFLWVRAIANHALGEPWETDREWAADLLGMDVRLAPDFDVLRPLLP